MIRLQDSCVAPLVLDVAVCVSAAAFSAENALHERRAEHILRGYCRHRPLADAELAALADFMWAGASPPFATIPRPLPRPPGAALGALACGFYRWREFNVNRQDAAPETKEAYLIMQRRCEMLEATPIDPKAWVVAATKE